MLGLTFVFLTALAQLEVIVPYMNDFSATDAAAAKEFNELVFDVCPRAVREPSEVSRDKKYVESKGFEYIEGVSVKSPDFYFAQARTALAFVSPRSSASGRIKVCDIKGNGPLFGANWLRAKDKLVQISNPNRSMVGPWEDWGPITITSGKKPVYVLHFYHKPASLGASEEYQVSVFPAIPELMGKK